VLSGARISEARDAGPRYVTKSKRRPVDIEGGVLSLNRRILEAIPLLKPPVGLV
jgi:hypothetical protein